MHVAPGICAVPVRTPTLPPATHTNTWLVGEGELTVFDPASPYEDEQGRLAAALAARVADGETVARIVLTHHHGDHVSGAIALQRAFPAPIVAHPETAARLSGRVPVDAGWDDGATIDCGGVPLTAWHTPGHAAGHLVFLSPDGYCVAGDLVAGVGTILIDPRDGDLGQYLASLARVQSLHPTTLLPAHGPALPQAGAILAFYVAHRHQRSQQIRDALLQERATPTELVPKVYTDLPPEAHEVAALQITAHLRWLAEAGVVRRVKQAAATSLLDQRWEAT
jgi:ribonuclease/clavin/mitogillin